MKKFLTGLLVAAMMSLGLVGAAVTPASAVDATTYPGCLVAKLRVNKKSTIRVGGRQTVRVRLTAASNLKPTGTIMVYVKKLGAGKFVYKSDARPYTGVGQSLVFKTGKLTEVGRYKIIAVFVGDAPYCDLRNAKKQFRVKR